MDKCRLSIFSRRVCITTMYTEQNNYPPSHHHHHHHHRFGYCALSTPPTTQTEDLSCRCAKAPPTPHTSLTPLPLLLLHHVIRVHPDSRCQYKWQNRFGRRWRRYGERRLCTGRTIARLPRPAHAEGVGGRARRPGSGARRRSA